jgi:MOSC domain-containing protein YiiM
VTARLVAVSTGRPRQVGVRRGRPLMSAIFKAPVAGRVAAGPEGLDGDQQADLRVHGGPDKAVYAYAEEDTAWWAAELGRPLGPGAFGENLTVAGLDVTGAVVGERWRVGTTELEVCQPRQPCSKLGIRFGDPRMVKRFAQVARPGAYLRVLVPGDLAAGDPVEVVSRPPHDICVGLVFRAIMHEDDGLAARAAEAPELPPALAAWLRGRAPAA